MNEYFDFLKAQIRGEGWNQKECIQFLKAQKEPKSAIEECINCLKQDGYLKGKIKKSAPSVFEAMNQCTQDKENELLNKQDKYRNMLIKIFEALEVATELNDIDVINELNNLLIEKLPFTDDNEKELYLNYIQGFKDWQSYKKITFNIMMNIYKKKDL